MVQWMQWYGHECWWGIMLADGLHSCRRYPSLSHYSTIILIVIIIIKLLAFLPNSSLVLPDITVQIIPFVALFLIHLPQ